jgi:hypothetical protein
MLRGAHYQGRDASDSSDGLTHLGVEGSSLIHHLPRYKLKFRLAACSVSRLEAFLSNQRTCSFVYRFLLSPHPQQQSDSIHQISSERYFMSHHDV